jgi:hypothetical protein
VNRRKGEWDLTRANRLRDRRDAHAFMALSAAEGGGFVEFLNRTSVRDLEVLAVQLAAWYREEIADRLVRDEGVSRADARARIAEQQRAASVAAALELEQELEADRA